MLYDTNLQKHFDITEYAFRNTRIVTFVIDIITHIGIFYLKGRTYFDQTKSFCIIS